MSHSNQHAHTQGVEKPAVYEASSIANRALSNTAHRQTETPVAPHGWHHLVPSLSLRRGRRPRQINYACTPRLLRTPTFLAFCRDTRRVLERRGLGRQTGSSGSLLRWSIKTETMRDACTLVSNDLLPARLGQQKRLCPLGLARNAPYAYTSASATRVPFLPISSLWCSDRGAGFPSGTGISISALHCVLCKIGL